MSRILVTGSKGQLGNEFQLIAERGEVHDFIFVDIDTLDITNPSAVEAFFENQKIDYCINCAAYTAVDKAEQEKLIAIEINATGAKILAVNCRKVGATFVHISTDFVFDGKINTPYSESHYARPLSVYGKTKRKGEVEALVENPKSIIIRTSWLYSSFGNNFVKTMRRLGKERSELGIVFDQIGAPTYARDLAETIINIIVEIECEDSSDIYGLYHYSNAGICSWYDFAKAIFDLSQIDIKLKPILTEEYPLPAKRPHYSVMETIKIQTTFNIEIPYWRDSLKDCIQKIEKDA